MPQLRVLDRALRRLAALCTLAVGCLLFGAVFLDVAPHHAAPHRAALRLAAIDPADGAVLPAPPLRVTLTFTEPVSPTGSTATLGTRPLPVGRPPQAPEILVVDLTGVREMHGRVRVNWRSTRADGKGGATGVISFWVGPQPSATVSGGFSVTTYFNAAALLIIGSGLAALFALTSLRARSK